VPASDRLRILVVEDNQADIFLIRQAIAAAEIVADFHVLSDGKKAIGFVDAVDADDGAPCPDVVLLDLNLPKKSGDEVLRHLRQSRRCSNARVLIITSSGSPKDRELADGLGATGYFCKPSDYDEFMKLGVIVKELLRGHRDT
jgi:chemotaxis family two-component system response regulator Rcp1